MKPIFLEISAPDLAQELVERLAAPMIEFNAYQSIDCSDKDWATRLYVEVENNTAFININDFHATPAPSNLCSQSIGKLLNKAREQRIQVFICSNNPPANFQFEYDHLALQPVPV